MKQLVQTGANFFHDKDGKRIELIIVVAEANYKTIDARGEPVKSYECETYRFVTGEKPLRDFAKHLIEYADKMSEGTEPAPEADSKE